VRKEGYKKNRQRVFEIYGKKRGKGWDCHHIRWKSERGGNEKSNLFPTPKWLHSLFHSGASRQEIHDEIKKRGGDPYQ